MTRGIEGKPPPNDLEAEAGILGSLLMDAPSHVDAVPATLTPAKFYSQAHARVYEAIEDLRREHVDVGVTTVAARLRETGRYAQIGGVEGLADLVNSVPVLTRTMFDRLVRTVLNAAALREASAVLHEALARVYADESVQANDLIADTERKLQGLAIATTVGGLRHVKEALREEIGSWHDRADGGGVVGIPTGFTALDNNTGGWQRGDLVVLAARPGMGKTSLITACAVNVAKRGDATAIFSLEMPARQLAARMLCTEAGLSLLQTRTGKLPPAHLTRATEACNILAAIDVYLDDASRGRPTVADICARSRRLAAELARKGRRIGLIVVDYIQIVKLRDDLVKQRHELAVGEVSTELKSLAKELDTTVIGVAQLNRGVENRQDKRPGMSDLRDSGQIEQDADIIAMLYRDEYYNPGSNPGVAEVIIEKQRNGPTGTIKLWFDGPTTRFADLASERDEAAE